MGAGDRDCRSAHAAFTTPGGRVGFTPVYKVKAERLMDRALLGWVWTFLCFSKNTSKIVVLQPSVAGVQDLKKGTMHK